MARKATAVGVSGVAVAFTAPYHSPDEPDIWAADILVVGKLADSPDATAEWSPSGANYLGIAMGKLAQVCRTGQLFSGSPVEPDKSPLGESGYRGCITYEHPGGVLMRTTFSGGTEQEDVEIAAEGLVAMTKVFDLLARGLKVSISYVRVQTEDP